MDADTYSDKQIQSFARKYLVSLKIDAEKGEGIELANKLHIHGFPTIVFTNGAGEEIDRIVGYLPPEPFLDELKRIQNGINTLPALIKSAKSNPDNFSILYKLALKYEAMGNMASAKDKMQSILNAGTDSAGTAAFKILLYEAKEKTDPTPLIDFANENPRNNNSAIALQTAMLFVKRSGKNPTLEADLFLRYIHSLDTPSPGLLNSFCWRMSELELNLDLALEKIILAIENETHEEQKHMFIDTKAEVLWKLGRIEDAIFEIEKCIKYDPSDKYYKDQKMKFEGKN